MAPRIPEEAGRKHVMSLRLPDDLASDLQWAARVEGVSVSAFIRAAIADYINAKRTDPEFQAKLAAVVNWNIGALEALRVSVGRGSDNEKETSK